MKWEENYDEKDTIMNMKATKIIGLYHVLSPYSPRLFGYNIIHIIIALLTVYETIILTFCLIGVYYWKNNTSQVVLQLTIFSNFLFGCYKILFTIRKPGDLRKCIQVTCNDYMKYRFYKDVYFKKYRSKSLYITNAYMMLGFLILFMWSASSFVFGKSYIVLKNPKGIWCSYHLNAFNIFFPVDCENYNRYFILFHILEILFGGFYVVCSHNFDILLISMCFSISTHLKSIGNAYCTLRKKYSTTSNYDTLVKNLELKSKLLNDLKTIITDHQNILTKMEDFYHIIRSVILCQLVISMQTIVFILFIIILNFKSNAEEEISILTLKMCCAFPFFVIQLYITCYLFECINKEKYAIHHAIYFCGWEEMDIECQKLILMAMKMNNAHRVTIKITESKIVNLKMFANVIHMCYSILSVMVNSDIKS